MGFAEAIHTDSRHFCELVRYELVQAIAQILSAMNVACEIRSWSGHRTGVLHSIGIFEGLFSRLVTGHAGRGSGGFQSIAGLVVSGQEMFEMSRVGSGDPTGDPTREV